MKALAIAATDLRRLLRWRANVFFLFLLPMMIILLLGAAFGGANQARIGVVGGDRGARARSSSARLTPPAVDRAARYADRARPAARRRPRALDAGLVLPPTTTRVCAAGRPAALGYLARPDSVAQQLGATIESVAAEQAPCVRRRPADRARRATRFARALARARRRRPPCRRCACA